VTWQSRPGGVWSAEVRELNFRNRLPGLDGTFLYLWCYAPEAIAAGDLEATTETVEELTGREPQRLGDWLRANPDSWRHLLHTS